VGIVCVDFEAGRGEFNGWLQNPDRWPLSPLNVPEVLVKAPDGFEPPQKALLALPFPLGYGAMMKARNNGAICCPKF
jgi:hypothetical protein